MSSELQELRERITGLTDDELIEMVTVGAGDYRREALEFARAELTRRGVDFSEKESGGEEQPASEFDPFPITPRSGPAESVCGVCGGQLRAGTLVAEKELTIIFNDNREERFVKVTACVQCGQLALVADFDTNVGS
jgi:hypothetical protein